MNTGTNDGNSKRYEVLQLILQLSRDDIMIRLEIKIS